MPDVERRQMWDATVAGYVRNFLDWFSVHIESDMSEGNAPDPDDMGIYWWPEKTLDLFHAIEGLCDKFEVGIDLDVLYAGLLSAGEVSNE